MGAGRLNRPLFGIVGLGRFGRLAAAHLRRHGEVVAYDTRNVVPVAVETGIRMVPLREAAQARIVFLCVPIRFVAAALEELAPHLLPRTLVVDACSVKVEPARLMLELLPEWVDVLGTHPLFGPDSAADGIAGLKIVLCPLRRGHARLARRFLEGLGLTVLIASPEEHDRQIAETQAIVQWIGRGLERIGAGPRQIETTGHTRLLEILRYVSRDSWQLFVDMQNRNPFAAEARQRFITAMREVEEAMIEPFEVVYRASGTTEAEIIRGFLESRGIPVDLDYESAGKVYGLTMDGLGEVRVLVPADFAPMARAAIASRETAGAEPEEGGAA
jgi:prephenate dehydrogenase